MFVTKNQIYVFLACVAFGGGAGILFSFSQAISYMIKNKVLKILPSIFAALPLIVVFILYGYNMNFPNLRLYMIIGVFCGICLYFKSFNIILEKYGKKFYNIYKSKRKQGK